MTLSPIYPSYVDLDPFIDVERLRALDGSLRERLQRRLDRERDLAFYTGPFLLEQGAAAVPGSRMVALSRSAREEVYYDLDRTELWSPSDEAAEFADLMGFIETLPFKARGRMMIIYDELGRAVSAHRDHDEADLCRRISSGSAQSRQALLHAEPADRASARRALPRRLVRYGLPVSRRGCDRRSSPGASG
jgi:hypothetical protein